MFVVFFTLSVGVLRMAPALAQDLEPRRWTPLPLGINVFGAGYGYSTGDVFFNPLLKVEDADVDANLLVVTHVNSFSLGGKLARFDVLVPWHSARWEGLLDGTPASTTRKGIADPRFRISLNLMGAPAAGPAKLGQYVAERPIRTVVGAALSVSVPLGDYHDDKLINLGRNRYVVRPQIGVVHSRESWSYELTGSMFYYTDNTNFYNGGTLETAPIYAMQAHVVRTLKPRTWVSLSAGYGSGGRSTLNGEKKNDEKANLLMALSYGFPLVRNQSAKIVYLRARTQNDTGVDIDSLIFAWSIIY